MKKICLLISILIFACYLSGCSSKPKFRVDPDIISQRASCVESPSLLLTQEILDAGIFNPGNTERLMNVMEKAANGEDITICYLGGSITEGYSASPMDTSCYAYLSTKWWEDTFPMANINYVNAGIGGTDSYLGIHRLQSDVLLYEPDLCIVEFSVNDTEAHNKESYESIIRELLNYETEPAVICLLLTMESGYDYTVDHTLVAFNYQVPIISYKAALDAGNISWNRVGNSDGVHPTNSGHLLIAGLLTSFYCDVLDNINTASEEPFSVKTDTLTKCRYTCASILYSDSFSEDSSEGFSKETIVTALTNNNGWYCSSGGSITFTVNAKTIGVLYLKTTDGNSGQYDVYVDGQYADLIDADFKGGWGNAIASTEVLLSDTVSEHTLTITINENSEGSALNLLGIMISR